MYKEKGQANEKKTGNYIFMHGFNSAEYDGGICGRGWEYRGLNGG